MNQQEMISLVNEKIAGQFNQIDAGNALAPILSALIQSAAPTEVESITEIPGTVLDKLQCGDKIAKITGKQKHLYVVTYKGEGVGEGICLTYCAAGLIETVSYDYTADGWVYNSTDKCTINID